MRSGDEFKYPKLDKSKNRKRKQQVLLLRLQVWKIKESFLGIELTITKPYNFLKKVDFFSGIVNWSVKKNENDWFLMNFMMLKDSTNQIEVVYSNWLWEES